MGGNGTPRVLFVRCQFAEATQRVGPVSLLLVQAHQLIQRPLAPARCTGEFHEQLFGAIHQAGGNEIAGQFEARAISD